MKLADLLEHTAQDFLDDRSVLIEGDDDSLYPDTLLVRYFNLAQDILCRRAWVVIDHAHPAAGVVVLQTGKSLYDLHKSVLRVLSVVPSDQVAPIHNYDDAALLGERVGPDSWWPDIDSAVAASTGRPIGYSTQTGSRLMRVYRTPSSTENGLKLNMRIARLPVEVLTVEDMDGVPEIPDEYHMWLCDYAAGRCLTQPNCDENHKAEGRRLLEEFDAHVREARQERQRFMLNSATWRFNSSTALV